MTKNREEIEITVDDLKRGDRLVRSREMENGWQETTYVSVIYVNKFNSEVVIEFFSDIVVWSIDRVNKCGFRRL